MSCHDHLTLNGKFADGGKKNVNIFGGVSNLSREPSTAGEEFRMAAAGPAMSVLIGLVSLLLYRALPGPSWLAAVFGYLGLTNLLLAAFNLLPAFPLDGGRVLHSIIWGSSHNSVLATRWASTIGEGFGWLFIAGASGWSSPATSSTASGSR